MNLGPLADLTFDEAQIAIDRELCRRDLGEFVKRAWAVLEPPTQPLVWEWPHDAVAEHLMAVSNDKINRLLVNIPPGMLKSMLTNVFWPAWEWGPLNRPYLRTIGTAFKLGLAIRDSVKMNRLILSDWFQARWGHQFTLLKDTEEKFETDKSGFRAAFPSTSITGERGDRLIFDDPHSVDGAKSDAERTAVTESFRESMQTRLNNPDRSAIVVIMQRLHHEDVSGVILKDFREFTHLCLPMEFEPARRCVTSIGFVDPRTEDGELLSPGRFPAKVVRSLAKNLGPYAAAGQLQQRPEPRGGGILKRDHWSTWDKDTAEALGVPAGRFPSFDFVLATVDTAYTEKEENDPCAMSIWGVWRDERSFPQIMLMYSWAERLQFNDLVERIERDCKRFRVDTLMIESKAAGISTAQEIERRQREKGTGRWNVRLYDPGRLDKIARAYSVQGILDSGMVWAPNTRWADEHIGECAVFPKGSHDDRVDTTTMALSHLRAMGFVRHEDEVESEIERMKTHTGQKFVPLYPS